MMKLLLDSCIARPVVDELLAAGIDLDYVGDWSNDPGDQSILEYAADQQRTLVTLDKDFGELAVVHGHTHHGVIRITNLSLRLQANAIQQVLHQCASDLQQGALATTTMRTTTMMRSAATTWSADG